MLVGLPGSGKTTVAEAVARRWNVDAIDTDDLVARSVGCTPADYLRSHGEAAFRDREFEALGLGLQSDVVVATGGGVVTEARSRDLLANEMTIWLDCADDELAIRVEGGDRPLLGDDPLGAIGRLRALREEWYRAVSRDRVESSGPLEEVVTRVLEEVGRARG